MGGNKIIRYREPNDLNELVNKSYVDQKVSQAGGSVDLTPYLKKDGSVLMTNDFNLNNNQIKNVKDAINNQDAVTLKQVNEGVASIALQNRQYTDKKIGESHITSHENSKNVFKYATDIIGELSADFGIEVDSLKTDFNQMQHNVRKNSFAIDVLKKTDGSNLYYGRWDWNLFKLIRDNFSQNYTCCIEICNPDIRYDNEFNSANLSFQGLNINIYYQATKKSSNQYHYIRSILNLSPDGTSQSIQRRIYIDFKSTFDNNSPSKFRLYALIYGIKNEFLHNLDQSIYDWEKAYEISSDEKFTIHMPINMNGFDILKTSHYLHGYLITNLSDKTFIINGSKRIIIPSGSIIRQIQILYNSFKLNYEKLNIQIHYGFQFAFNDFFISDQNTHIQTLNMI